MPNALLLLIKQLKEIWEHFGVAQKFSIVGALVLVIALIAGLLYWSARPDYRLLYSGLSMKDAAAVQETLTDEKIPYTLKDSGRSVFVRSTDLYRTRLLLAGEGLPKEPTAGFELFEQPKFGLTDFAQQINYQRALQGELERTISAMRGIESARVMLVLPKDKLFATDEEKKASASIMLTLSGGAVLNQGQVMSISQLVSSSVPSLAPNNVTITDQYGKLLSQRASGEDSITEQADDQLMAQEKIERLLTKKAQDMLDKALGVGNSIVRINALLDFSQIERRNEKYDAEGRTVRSEVISKESSSAPAPGGGGVAGVVANVPVGSPASSTVETELSKSKKENIRTEYAVPSEVEHVIQKGARISKLSVSVCVAQGEQPRDDKQKQDIEQMVSSSVGLVDDGKRQDVIEVTEMVFPAQPVPPGTPWWQRFPVNFSAIGRGLLAVLLVFIIFRMSRKVIASMVIRREDIGVPIQALTEEYAGMRSAAAEPEQLEGPAANLQTISKLAEENPKAIAAWISSMSEES